MRDNEPARRFELAEAGGTAYADYERRPDALVIRFVFAPPPLRGTGAADRLMAAIVVQARAENRRIVPLCGYAARWMEVHGRGDGSRAR